MPQTIFTPNLEVESEKNPVVEVLQDRPSDVLLLLTRVVAVLFVFLLPIFFMPGLWATLEFQKVSLALGCVAVVVFVLSLLMLRQSRVRTIIPMPWICFLGFVGVAGVSAIFSSNPTTAFRGDTIETGTVAFFAILASVMVLPLVLQRSKRSVLIALQALVVSSLMLLVYCVSRLFFGPILAFESFGAVTVSPLGGFNDLAVFAGFCVLLSLITMLQLPRAILVQSLLLVVTLLSLVILAAANFFFVWLIVGFFGLLILLYIVSRNQLFVAVADTPMKQTAPGSILVVTTAIVCLVSAWFVVAGDTASNQINQVFDVSYLEVRPSFSATVDIAQQVYADNILLGTGPNQFVSAWRAFKDTSINETIFWATDFTAGSSYSTTIGVTTGALGLALFMVFHGWYAWFGFRLLVLSKQQDTFWYFVGAVSFAGAAFLWLMTHLYVPGATILLLAAFLTGLSFVAGARLLPQSVYRITLVSNRRRGFILMAFAVLLISGAVGSLFTTSQQYLAQATFNQVQATAIDVAEVDQAAQAAYSQYKDDVFLGVQAQIALLEMNQLLSVIDPTEAQEQQFLSVSSRAIVLSNQAIAAAPQTPAHHVVLAAVYNNLAVAGVTDALERSLSSLETAKDLDPKNPTYSLVEAQMAVRRGDVETARRALLSALETKRNFTEALFLLSQIDIAEGNVAEAIESTRAIITLEPNNPTRYYQLGILLSAAGETDAALAAYEIALQLDPSYANARYVRALLLADIGQIAVAIDELRMVQENNQENEQLEALIGQLLDGVVPTQSGVDDVETPVLELTPQAADETTTSPTVPDSDLLTPLNTVSSDTGEGLEMPTESVIDNQTDEQ